MLKTLFRLAALLVLIALVSAAALTRLTGAVIKNAEGKRIGYSQATHEWLFLEYPGVRPCRDGPYVFRDGKRRTALRLDRRHAEDAVEAITAEVGKKVEVQVDDAQGTRFSVPLRDEYPRQPTTWPMPRRMLVLSDIEGQFEALRALLQHSGVIDRRMHWRFGDGRLVLVGDLVDRGNNVVPVLWLLYRLEAEAQAAGGGLHYVLGNHEQMMMLGRADYVAPKYLATFRLGGQNQQALWSGRSELGLWLRSKPVLLKIGDVLFVHGGVSADVLAAGVDLDAVDALAARYLATDPRGGDAIAQRVLSGRTGLLWYRGLAMPTDDYPKDDAAHVQRVLEAFGVGHIAIGHTMVQHVGEDVGGKVLRVDVDHAAGVSEALWFEDGAIQSVDAQGRRRPLRPARNLED